MPQDYSKSPDRLSQKPVNQQSSLQVLHIHYMNMMLVCPVGQAAHIAPPVPHELGPICAAYSSHLPAAVQQPVGHVLASHTQVPLVVLPLLVSHRPFAQGAQLAPEAPHCVGDSDP